MKKQSDFVKVKKGDIVVLACLAAVCILLFVMPLLKDNSSKTAVIMLDGEVVESVELLPDKSKRLTVGACVVLVENGTVCFEEASCPDKLCIKSGTLSRVGDTAACVPNKVVVTIEGKNKNNYDMVAY